MKRTQRQLKRSGQHQAEVEAAIGYCGSPHLAGSNAAVVGQHDKDLQGVMFKGQANLHAVHLPAWHALQPGGSRRG